MGETYTHPNKKRLWRSRLHTAQLHFRAFRGGGICRIYRVHRIVHVRYHTTEHTLSYLQYPLNINLTYRTATESTCSQQKKKNPRDSNTAPCTTPITAPYKQAQTSSASTAIIDKRILLLIGQTVNYDNPWMNCPSPSIRARRLITKPRQPPSSITNYRNLECCMLHA